MAGRKPKPTAVKKLEGNPGKRKLNTKEPVPAKGMLEQGYCRLQRMWHRCFRQSSRIEMHRKWRKL